MTTMYVHVQLDRTQDEDKNPGASAIMHSVSGDVFLNKKGVCRVIAILGAIDLADEMKRCGCPGCARDLPHVEAAIASLRHIVLKAETEENIPHVKN